MLTNQIRGIETFTDLFLIFFFNMYIQADVSCK